MEEPELTQKVFAETIVSLLDAFQEDLFKCKEADLEQYWHFKYNREHPLVYNFYKFFSMLELYRGSCRRWEEHTNGICCVVERVRDKYLIPKIKKFINDIEADNQPLNHERAKSVQIRKT